MGGPSSTDIFGSVPGGKAQNITSTDLNVELDSWSFDDTNWLSDLGYPPIGFTNLFNPPSFDGNALQVDFTNVAASWQLGDVARHVKTQRHPLGLSIGEQNLWVIERLGATLTKYWIFLNQYLLKLERNLNSFHLSVIRGTTVLSCIVNNAQACVYPGK